MDKYGNQGSLDGSGRLNRTRRRHNRKPIGGQSLSTNPNNREQLACCSQGCYDTTWWAHCQEVWDPMVGLYRRELVISNPGGWGGDIIGGAQGCTFAHLGGEEAVKQQELRIAHRSGNRCEAWTWIPQGPSMYDCNHELDFCHYDGHMRSFCAGWYMNPDNQGWDTSWSWSGDTDAPFECGNWHPILPREEELPPEYRQGGRIPRRGRR